MIKNNINPVPPSGCKNVSNVKTAPATKGITAGINPFNNF